jgi:predicted HAD superfamily Cof-like phosphohydrolase
MTREFHSALHVHGGFAPGSPTADVPERLAKLRQALLDEEVEELRDAVAAGDIVKIADAIGDIAYVIGGTAVTYGIPFDAVVLAVHRSNMTKTNTPDEAKLVKGPGYEPPRIAEVLRAAGRTA